MSESFDHTFDVVVVGTGAAGFATAMGAADEGLSAVLLEGTDRWGGSTSMSGGGMWLPDNPLMQRDKAGDSRDEALAYLEATVGDDYRATSRQRKEAFVDSVGDFVRTAQRSGSAYLLPTTPTTTPSFPAARSGVPSRSSRRQLPDWWSSCRHADQDRRRVLPGVPGSGGVVRGPNLSPWRFLSCQRRTSRASAPGWRVPCWRRW
jgi:3-oxosteroid 1-dehydrogenase